MAATSTRTRAMGLHPVVEPEVTSLPVLPGDLFLFCSDGLTDPLNDAQLATILGHYGTEIDQASRALIDAANACGGPDNITVILDHGHPGRGPVAGRVGGVVAFVLGCSTASMP